MFNKYECQKYMNKYIKPYIHNKYTYQCLYNMLSTPVYFAPYNLVFKKLNNKSNKDLVSKTYHNHFNKTYPGFIFDRTPATLTYIGEYAHDWWEMGNLNHSIAVHQQALNLWFLWKRQIPKDWFNNKDFSKWVEETEDAINIGSFLHDIGKVGQRFECFKGKDTQYIHEMIGYELADYFLPNDSLTEKIKQVIKGHSAFFIKDNRVCMKSTKFQPYKSKTYCQLAPFIVCFADKIVAAKSSYESKKKLANQAYYNNQKEEYEMLKRDYKLAKKNIKLYENHFEEYFLKNKYQNYKYENFEITYNFRKDYGFKLFLHN